MGSYKSSRGQQAEGKCHWFPRPLQNLFDERRISKARPIVAKVHRRYRRCMACPVSNPLIVLRLYLPNLPHRTCRRFRHPSPKNLYRKTGKWLRRGLPPYRSTSCSRKNGKTPPGGRFAPLRPGGCNTVLLLYSSSGLHLKRLIWWPQSGNNRR